jgi:hypothetical protein
VHRIVVAIARALLAWHRRRVACLERFIARDILYRDTNEWLA